MLISTCLTDVNQRNLKKKKKKKKKKTEEEKKKEKPTSNVHLVFFNNVYIL